MGLAPEESVVPDKKSAPAAKTAQRVIKKYPNRRLYDTQSSSYITLADVKRMVMGAEDFVVRDAKTGEDLTRSILLQIILEEEASWRKKLEDEVASLRGELKALQETFEEFKRQFE